MLILGGKSVEVFGALPRLQPRSNVEFSLVKGLSKMQPTQSGSPITIIIIIIII
jgi:hypothetical protein